MAQPIPENILNRYRGAKARVDQGTTPSERSTAAGIVYQMEEKYPGIRAQAYPPPPRQDVPGFDAFTPSDGNFGGTGEASKLDWRKILRQQAEKIAGDALRYAASQDFERVAAAAAAEAAKQRGGGVSIGDIAERITEFQSKTLPSGKYQIAVKFDIDELTHWIDKMNDAQTAEFIEVVTGLFRDQLVYSLTPE